MRDLFNLSEENGAALPRKLKSTGVKRLIERALWAQGLRRTLQEGSRRHEFAADHGFRKFFKSQAEKWMKNIHVEMAMGHSLSLGDSYYRPSDKELLQDYIKAVPYLTFFSESVTRESERTAREVEDLKKTVRELLQWKRNMTEYMRLRLPDYAALMDEDEEMRRKRISEAEAELRKRFGYEQ